MFWLIHSIYTNYYSRTPNIGAAGTIVNVFSYDTVLGRDLNLSSSRQQAEKQCSMVLWMHTFLYILYVPTFVLLQYIFISRNGWASEGSRCSGHQGPVRDTGPARTNKQQAGNPGTLSNDGEILSFFRKLESYNYNIIFFS